MIFLLRICNDRNVTSRRFTLRRFVDHDRMGEHEQTVYMRGNPIKWRKNGLERGGLLLLRSQSTEREGKRELILTLRTGDENQKK